VIKCWYCNEELTSATYCDEHIGICTKCYRSMFQGNKIVKGWMDKISDLEAKLAEQPKQIVDKIKDFVYNNYIYVEETDLRVIKYDLLYKFLDNLIKEMK
jgi:hypothetical protein